MLADGLRGARLRYGTGRVLLALPGGEPAVAGVAGAGAEGAAVTRVWVGFILIGGAMISAAMTTGRDIGSWIEAIAGMTLLVEHLVLRLNARSTP